MTDIALYIIIGLFSFLIGYTFCYLFNDLEKLIKVYHIFSSMANKEITPEQAIKQFNNILR